MLMIRHSSSSPMSSSSSASLLSWTSSCSISQKFIKNHHMVVTSLVKHTLPPLPSETSRIHLGPLPLARGVIYGWPPRLSVLNLLQHNLFLIDLRLKKCVIKLSILVHLYLILFLIDTQLKNCQNYIYKVGICSFLLIKSCV